MVDDLMAAGRGRTTLALLLSAALPIACGGDDVNATTDASSSSGSESSSGTTGPTTTLTSADTSSSSSDSTSGSSSGSESGSGSGSESGSTTTDASSSSSDGSSSSGVESSESGTVELECPVGELDPSSEDPVFGNTLGRDDDFTGSCGGDGAPDVGFVFTAPADGLYTFDTVGSQLDTVLYLLDGQCSGSELACDDDGSDSQSALTLQLAADQTVTVVVDGNEAVGGPFSLRVRAGNFTCPVGDIGAVAPIEVVGDNTDAYDAFSSSCNGGGGPEDGWLFTAPATATYTIDTFGSSFPGVVYVLDGTCSGAEIACGEEGALVDLVVGQQVTIMVDSHFEVGPYELNIGTLGGACPDVDLGSSVPQAIVGDTSDGDNTTASTCGGEFSPDDLYLFTAPSAGLYSIDTFGSTLDTVLYLRDGGCGGPELDCNDDFTNGNEQSRLLAGLAAGQTVMIGVDGNGSGSYTLNVDEIACPDFSLGNLAPQTAFGDTTGGFDKLVGSCSSGNANDESPDVAYSFTAPEDGEYVFDTEGSAFNTVLYVLDGPACNAPEIACSDNFSFQQTSALAVPLSANETVIVVVDGNFNGSGDYVLNVQQLGGGLCPDEDLGSTVPNTIVGDTADGDNTVAATCGGFTQPDDTYLFTADQDGLYVFDTFGSGYDTVLFVREGGCDGVELACNDDYQFGIESRVGVDLSVGETVMVAVDGNFAAGDYTLNVQYAMCPDEDLDSLYPHTVDGMTAGGIDKLDSPLCPDDGSPDYVFEWTAPEDGTYTFDLQGSDYDTVIFLQDAACGGEELACNDDFFGLQSAVTVDLAADQTIVIVVSGFFGDSGNFTLNIS